MKNDLKLTALVRMFEEAEEANVTGRDLAHRCRDYYDGKQLTSEEVAELRRRKQPAIVINRIRRKIDWLRGLEMEARTDPRAFPRTPRSEQGAEAATDAIRYVCDASNFDKLRSKVWSNMLIEGLGGVEIIHRDGKHGPDVEVNAYSHDRLFYDPHSVAPDFSDARYKGAVIWSDAEDLEAEYPDKKDEIAASINITNSAFGDTYEDKPYWQIWSDPHRKRVRCVLVHYRKGKVWHWAKYVRGGILEEGESEYQDEDGESVCPLIMVSAYVDRDGMRYGVVRDMLDPQDEINKRRSKLLHQLNTRQTQTVKGAISVRALKAAMASPDGNVELDPDAASLAAELGVPAFQVLPNNDQIAGQASLLQEAKDEIDLMGANSGLQGKEQGSGQSGRAIMARQRGGMIEIAPLVDRMSDFTLECYRHIWMRIRQFWTEERWVRVTDEERNTRFVGLNRRITLQEHLQTLPEDQVMMIARQMMLAPGDPRLQEPVGIENAVEEMDVDILVEEMPDVVTLESETFEQIVQIASATPGAIPPEIIIETAPGLRRDMKERILERMQQMQEAQGQQAQAAEQMQGQRAQAQTAKDAAAAEKSQADAMKTQIEAQRLALGY